MQVVRLREVVAVAMLVSTAGSRAQVIKSFEHMVTIGNGGNAADSTSYGAVAYTFQISKYEVTAGEYAAFLNAAAKADPYSLYTTYMDYYLDESGCQITRHGSSGSYTYDFSGRPSGEESDWHNRPVNYVNWYNAARYANWLTSGDTESGVYNTSTWVPDRGYRNAQGMAYFIPTEDEWYKAAFYSPLLNAGSGGYYDYPTGSDTAPTSVAPSGDGNSANIYGTDYALGLPYYRSEVGAYADSQNDYGTFDQAGNVWEWTETRVVDMFTWNVVGGGSYAGDAGYARSDSHTKMWSWVGPNDVGFRVAAVPEPASVALLAFGGLLRLMRTKRRLGSSRPRSNR